MGGGQRRDALAGNGQALAQALCMAAQPPLFEAQCDGALQHRRAGQAIEQLGVGQRPQSLGRRGQIADAPGRCQHLGEAADIGHPLHPVERGQARLVLWREKAIAVVLDDEEVVRIRQTQQPVCRCQVQAVAGRVVQHRHGQIGPGLMCRRQRCEGVEVGAPGAARHRQQPDAGLAQAGEHHGPARVVHQHGVARLQLRADDQVERVGGAVGRQDVVWAGVNAEVGQTLAQGFAQAQVAAGVAVADLHGEPLGAVQAAQRGLQQRRVQPVGRQGAQPRRARGIGLEHAADQCGGVNRRLTRRRGRCRHGARRRHGLAHEEAALAPRLQQARRLELVVGGDDGMRADAVLARAVAH
mmetsp:Transcript_5512/g.13250  ORF Transcript_5512/g.13250 Transcript_5512/m.13250 type:complete len:355 (+) Transcript_5512:2429-3493(+)